MLSRLEHQTCYVRISKYHLLLLLILLKKNFFNHSILILISLVILSQSLSMEFSSLQTWNSDLRQLNLPRLPFYMFSSHDFKNYVYSTDSHMYSSCCNLFPELQTYRLSWLVDIWFKMFSRQVIFNMAQTFF